MKSRKRGLRRAQKERVKAWALRKAKEQIRGGWYYRREAARIVEGWLRRAEHPQCCSCYGCGNQRKYEGDTIQERRYAEK